MWDIGIGTLFGNSLWESMSNDATILHWNIVTPRYGYGYGAHHFLIFVPL